MTHVGRILFFNYFHLPGWEMDYVLKKKKLSGMACCIIFTGLATGYDYNNNNHVEGDHTAPAEWKIMFDQKKKKNGRGSNSLN